MDNRLCLGGGSGAGDAPGCGTGNGFGWLAEIGHISDFHGYGYGEAPGEDNGFGGAFCKGSAPGRAEGEVREYCGGREDGLGLGYGPGSDLSDANCPLFGEDIFLVRMGSVVGQTFVDQASIYFTREEAEAALSIMVMSGCPSTMAIHGLGRN